MIGPDDMLAAAVATTLRYRRARPRPPRRADVEHALRAWKRLRLELCGALRRVA